MPAAALRRIQRWAKWRYARSRGCDAQRAIDREWHAQRHPRLVRAALERDDHLSPEWCSSAGACYQMLFPRFTAVRSKCVRFGDIENPRERYGQKIRGSWVMSSPVAGEKRKNPVLSKHRVKKSKWRRARRGRTGIEGCGKDFSPFFVRRLHQAPSIPEFSVDSFPSGFSSSSHERTSNASAVNREKAFHNAHLG